MVNDKETRLILRRPTPEMLLRWIKAKKPEPEEVKLAEKILPGEYEVYADKLYNIVTEGKEVFQRMGASFFLRSGDMAVGITNAKGDIVTSYCGLNHTVAGIPPLIKFTLTYWSKEETVGIRDGDLFFNNDPLYGASHPPDMYMSMPIFYDGELIAWSFSAVHEPDCGAIEPSGLSLRAWNRYGQGIAVPSMKCGENHKLREDFVEMMCNFSRAPGMMKIDLAARAAACEILRKRVIELVEEKGIEFVKGLFTKMLVNTEKMAREKISKINDGVYRTVIFTDVVGPKPGETPGLVRIFCTMYKKGDEVTFDFTGTSPENESSYHSSIPLNIGYLCMQAFVYFFHDLPVSNAALNPINFVFPKGSILNPHPEASISMVPFLNGALLAAYPQCIYKGFYASEELRYVVGAPDGTGGSLIAFAGVNQWGHEISEISTRTLNAMGQGARVDHDGMDAYSCAHGPAAGRIPDIEEEEDVLGTIVLFTELSVDNFGHGKYRGGAGLDYCYVVHNIPYIAAINLPFAAGKVIPTQGLFGGYPAPPRPLVIIKDTDVVKQIEEGAEIPSNLVELVTKRPFKGEYIIKDQFLPAQPLMKGWLIASSTCGGSGYGDVLERDPELVIKDVKEGRLSKWAARNVYNVVFDEETLEIDWKATEKAREEERKRRIERGRPYLEFIEEWNKKKPPEEILVNYGDWPDAKKVREIIRI